MPDTIPSIRTVDDHDIAWVTDLMHLHPLDEPRKRFLQHLGSIEVAACPGSGKTTLVVAKLAILARHWDSATQGVCVLSHTNVAREEIQRRLADSEVGHRLLGYPHFIDTIHGFSNRFLALPWLLSQGIRVTSIDDDIASAVRIRSLGQKRFVVERVLEPRRKKVSDLRLGSSDLSNPTVHDFPARAQTNSYQAAAAALRVSAQQGFFRHDEMLLFAEAMISERPEVVEILARRFPVVLVDEMQDTSPQQLRILDAAFGAGLVRMQRVGDPNQAIYSHVEEAESTATCFPDPSRECTSIPNSYRFSDSIAGLADALAVATVEPAGLKGMRCDNDVPTRNAVFVFPNGNASGVLDAFAAHVLDEFDDAMLSGGTVFAVGQVHQPRDDLMPTDAMYPATIAHYTTNYRHDFRSGSSHPSTLVGSLRKVRSMFVAGSRASEAVDVAAGGIINMMNRAVEKPALRMGFRPHRSLERTLAERVYARDVYRRILARFVVGDEELTREVWAALQPDLIVLACSLANKFNPQAIDAHTRWSEGGPAQPAEKEAPPPTNVHRVSLDGRTVDVHLGTIHSVKGQTHFATLLLETHNYQHVLKFLLPWLRGEKHGGASAPAQRNRVRLRLAYVAMTRPSHLLCLALPESSLGADDTQRMAARDALAAHGWKLVDVK